MSSVVNSPPSRNPADDGSLMGMLRLFRTKLLQNTDDMLPAEVIAYDRTTNLAQVQPLIAMVTTNNIIVERAQVAAIPVLQLGGGGFTLSFPVTTGNLGWIKANDYDISLFKTSYQNSPPNTQRMRSFSDAIFIPDTMLQGVTIAGEDAANAVFQNNAGTVKIALWSDLIKILAPAGIGIGGTPETGAILDVKSTTQAFVPPRMTTTQRNAIPSPQEGFTIYNMTTHSLETYTNSGWP